MAEAIKIEVNTKEFQVLIDDFKEILERKEAKIKELESRIEAIERCPAVETDLP